MINIQRLPVFVEEAFSYQMPDFDFWKQQVQSIILVEENKNIHNHDTTPYEECNVFAKRTAWNSHMRYPALNNLCEQIKNCIKEFVKLEGYDIPELETNDCWINWYDKDQHAQPHNHGAQLAAVLFVDVEESNAQFFFHANRNSVFVKKSDSVTNFSNIKKMSVKNGTLVFFDGNMMHSVSANKTNKPRITVAMNFGVVYKQERGSY